MHDPIHLVQDPCPIYSCKTSLSPGTHSSSSCFFDVFASTSSHHRHFQSIFPSFEIMTAADLSSNHADILEVARTCNCSEDRAARLLKVCWLYPGISFYSLLIHAPKKADGHVQKAIHLYEILSRYFPQTSSSLQITASSTPARSSTPSSPTTTGTGAHDVFFRNRDSVIPFTGSETVNLNHEESHSASTTTNGVHPPTLQPDTTPCSSDATGSPSRRPSLATPSGKVDNDVEEATEPPPQDSEWDFVLPCVIRPPSLEPGGSFSITELVGATTHGFSLESIQYYLRYYDQKTVGEHLNHDVNGVPAIFYAVSTNDVMIVRTYVDHGADVLAFHQPSGTPLLAFAVVHSDTIQADTTSMVATLLSLGTPPTLIPSELYKPYHQDLPDVDRSLHASYPEDPNTKWCTDVAKRHLLKTANLTQRYHLHRATKLKKASARHRQVTRLKHAEPILGIPYFLIGQTIAADTLLQKLLSHLVTPNQETLVLAFAGPSGHGKTELARGLGQLLSLDLEVVDCTIVRREMELFGPRQPFQGAGRGSSINHFLARHNGERCIVFLDEFEKTTSEIHQALLLPFDNGMHQSLEMIALFL